MVSYRNGIRLSLRTALLIMTVVCLFLGHRAYVDKIQRDALHSIYDLGGKIQGDATQSSPFQSLIGNDRSMHAREVTSVAFLGADFDDSDIDEFSRCASMLPRLRQVMMTDTLVTMDGEWLLRSKLPNLEINVINLIDQQKPFGAY